jgi:hypothetical protein
MTDSTDTAASAEQIGRSTRERLARIADKQKNSGAERVDRMANVIHSAASELGREIPGAAEFIHAAASRLEDGARALRENDVDSLVEKLNEVGRRQPLTILGGAFVAGFAITRFLKSSALTGPKHGAQR